VISGLLLGLGAGCCAALSNFFSRGFQKNGRTPLQLMLLGNLIMGTIALSLLPFFYLPTKAPFATTSFFLIGVVGAYYAGMLSLFGLLKQVQSSTVTSLLGLKLLFISVVSSLQGHNLSPIQWVAVSLMILASLTLKNPREGVSFKQVLWAMACCTCFGVSDLCIVQLVKAYDENGGYAASMMALIASYLLSGSVSLLLFKWWKSSTLKDGLAASGFGLFWFGHMLCLYNAIPIIGLVHSVILQSSRSIFAILIGIWVSNTMTQNNESKVSRSMRWRQWVSATLVVGATILYQNP
jgi:drug/metabolite transporter (DMT)-like permease